MIYHLQVLVINDGWDYGTQIDTDSAFREYVIQETQPWAALLCPDKFFISQIDYYFTTAEPKVHDRRRKNNSPQMFHNPPKVHRPNNQIQPPRVEQPKGHSPPRGQPTQGHPFKGHPAGGHDDRIQFLEGQQHPQKDNHNLPKGHPVNGHGHPQQGQGHPFQGQGQPQQGQGHRIQGQCHPQQGQGHPQQGQGHLFQVQCHPKQGQGHPKQSPGFRE